MADNLQVVNFMFIIDGEFICWIAIDQEHGIVLGQA